MTNDGFYPLIAADKVKEGELTAVDATPATFGRSLLLTRHEGKLYAFAGRCPHAGAKFDADSLHRWKLTCPDHDFCFDIRSGRILWPADEMVRLRCYEVREERGQLFVKLF